MRSYVYRGRRPIRDFRAAPAAPPPVAPPPVAPDPEPTPDYMSWLKADLVAFASGLGIDPSGTKADIIARLPHG